MSIRTRWRRIFEEQVRRPRTAGGSRNGSARRGASIIGLIAGAALLSSVAAAAPPSSVTGSWVILADQTYTTLDITNQGGPGGPGGSACRVILGSIGISPINGFYCPETGRIHFLHRNPSTNVVVRTFTGSVSAATDDAPAHIGGTLNVLNIGLGPFGEYPFSGSK
jgi:hypothetical protein